MPDSSLFQASEASRREEAFMAARRIPVTSKEPSTSTPVNVVISETVRRSFSWRLPTWLRLPRAWKPIE